MPTPNFFVLIGNALLQLAGGDPSVFLFWISLLVVTLWLFKEIKKTITDDKSLQVSRIDHKLEIYGRLECNILLYLRLKNEDSQKLIYEKLGESYSALSKPIYDKLFESLKSSDDDKLEECVKDIHEEVLNLKNRREQIYPMIYSNGVFESFYYYMNIIERIFLPIIFTYFAFLFIFIIIAVVYVIIHLPTISDKATSLISLFSGFLLLLLVLKALSELFNRDYKNIRWREVGPILIFSIINIVLIGHLYYQILVFILLFGYQLLIKKISFNRK
ncbi:hypothetical protein DNHGIG_15270 [Collibacillus ludicampi]|uniref:Uncharacterized protein n=2 Tax=Collibacillus ludicampi TaxID=2771369 RepID=A0AAV4LE83_9BACL|nr:hypothetical protein DNHGIG_15270 [Collibacillus ludicampi]